MSRAAATLFVPDVRDMLGASVAFAAHNRSGQSDVFTVVGVVEDVPYGELGESPRPLVYTTLSDADAALRFQDFWLIRHRGDADEIVAALHELGGSIDEAYRIATPAELLDEQFAKRSVEAVLAMAGAFAFALALAGVTNALARTVADQSRQIGIRFALGATTADETRRIAATALADMLVAGSILCGLVVAGRYYAPTPLAVVTLPLVFVALAVIACVCALCSYASVHRLGRKAGITTSAVVEA